MPRPERDLAFERGDGRASQVDEVAARGRTVVLHGHGARFRRGLEHADPKRRAAIVSPRADLGVERLDRRDRTARVSVGRLPSGGSGSGGTPGWQLRDHDRGHVGIDTAFRDYDAHGSVNGLRCSGNRKATCSL